MKKLFTLILAMVAVVALNAATQVSFDFSDASAYGYANPEASKFTQVPSGAVLTKDDVTITITFEEGKNGFRFFAHSTTGVINLRAYVGSTFTIAAPEGKKLSAIVADGSNLSAAYLAEGMTGKTWSSEEGVASLTTKVIKSTVQFNTLTVTVIEDGEVPPTQETVKVNVAGAIAAGMALDSAKTSTDVYEVTGYVVNSQPYNAEYGNQIWFMADDAANSGAQEFEAYACTVSEDKVLMQVLDGDKVTLTGNITKYYDKKNQKFTIEIKNGTAIFVSKVDGDHSINGQSGGGGDTVPPLPEGVISCDDAVKAAANIADPQEEKATVEGGAVVVRGYVTYAYNESKGKQSAWLSDTKGSKSGVIEGSYLTVVEAVAVGDYVELAGTLAKYKKAASGDKPAEIIIEVINGSMVKIGPDGKPIEPAKPDTISVAKALEIGQALADKAVSEKEYVIKGYSCSITDAYSEQYKNETFWISDEKGVRTDDKTKAFCVYRGKPSTQKEIGLDALVQFKCKIKNYGGTIENDGSGIEVEVLEEGVVETLDTISVAKALEIGYDLLDNAVTEKKYVIDGYVSSIETYFDSQYKNETFWIADSLGSRAASNKEGAFYVYRGKPDTEKEIGLNAHVYVTVLITKYSKECKEPVIENSKSADVTVVAQGLEETIDSITVAQAMAIGQGMEQGSVTDNRYAITGYVSSIDVPFSAQFGNETFWITDTEGEKTSDKTKAFYVYRGKPNSENEIGLGAKISIVCKIKNFKGTIENDGMGIQFEVLNEGTPLEIDTITVTEALSIGMAMEDGAYSEDLYIVKGFATKAYAPDTCKTSQNVYMADDPEERGAFYAYNCSPDSLVKDGDYILVQGKLQKYVGSKGVTIEISNGSAVHGEAPELPAIPEITVAQALEMAKALTPEEGKSITIDEKYAIKGYVIEVEDEDEYTYLLSDDPNAESGEFRAFRCASIDAPVAEGDLVIVTGRIETMNIQSFYSYYVNAGVLKHYAPEGVEQVVLTEKAQKIMIDGAIYIIRNGKMFDVRGAQVR